MMAFQADSHNVKFFWEIQTDNKYGSGSLDLWMWKSVAALARVTSVE